jgi:hypothetical protein
LDLAVVIIITVRVAITVMLIFERRVWGTSLRRSPL